MEPESGGCFLEQRVQIKERQEKDPSPARHEGWISLGVKQLLHVGVSGGGG